MYNNFNEYKCPYCRSPLAYPQYNLNSNKRVFDHGPNPYVFNIEEETLNNKTFRTALWTGTHLQLTVMCLNPGEDIGAEVHTVDQFIRVEQGIGLAKLGYSQDCLDYQAPVNSEFAIIITWHNLINTGNCPLKLYSIYAPPNHPWNTVHETKAIAEAEEH